MKSVILKMKVKVRVQHLQWYHSMANINIYNVCLHYEILPRYDVGVNEVTYTHGQRNGQAPCYSRNLADLTNKNAQPKSWHTVKCNML